MRKLVLTALLVSGLAGVSAQNTFAQTQDTTIKTSKFQKVIKVARKGADGDTLKKESAPKGRFTGGITFTRIDWGFARLIDNGSFTLSKDNEFLDYRGAKTSTFSYDLAQFGYRFNPNFKIYISGGFDWTLIRLNNDITLHKNSPTMSFNQDSIHFTKNRLSSQYVHFPLNFEFRTKENSKGKRFYFVVGPEVAFLLEGMVKQKSKERGKEKIRNDYNFEPFRYGGTVRIGYGGIGLFTKYYFNDTFTTTAQKGLKNMAFGLTLGLN